MIPGTILYIEYIRSLDEMEQGMEAEFTIKCEFISMARSYSIISEELVINYDALLVKDIEQDKLLVVDPANCNIFFSV